jgi:hypothetical protein
MNTLTKEASVRIGTEKRANIWEQQERAAQEIPEASYIGPTIESNQN